MIEIRTFSAKETVDAGYKFGKKLKKGDIVCLSGDLGVGKTAFASGIASALGVTDYITSPTFTIVNEYNGSVPLYHFDAYRINGPDEMFEIGFDEYIDGRGIVIIEWPEMIKEILPDYAIWVTIKKDLKEGTDFRLIEIDAPKGEFSELL